MRSRKIIHVLSCHAEGEVGDVIIGGVALPQVIRSGRNVSFCTTMARCEISY